MPRTLFVEDAQCPKAKRTKTTWDLHAWTADANFGLDSNQYKYSTNRGISTSRIKHLKGGLGESRCGWPLIEDPNQIAQSVPIQK